MDQDRSTSGEASLRSSYTPATTFCGVAEGKCPPESTISGSESLGLQCISLDCDGAAHDIDVGFAELKLRVDVGCGSSGCAIASRRRNPFDRGQILGGRDRRLGSISPR